MDVLAHEPRPIGITSREKVASACVMGLALAVIAFLVGSAAQATFPDPIQTRDGVPVGVAHSPGGAVAAADDYITVEQATLERDPGRFAALVSQDYAASIKAGSLAAARDERLRDPAGMRLWASGGQSFTAVAAHRLDWYRGGNAEVTTWAGQVFWGPRQPPSQVWALGRADLFWRNGRWEVTAMITLPVPAPAPAALPQAAPVDDKAADFDLRLGGYLPVRYGSPR